jgi:hypothetical protein
LTVTPSPRFSQFIGGRIFYRGCKKVDKMSEEASYLLVSLCIAVGFLLVQICIARLSQRRQDRRIEQKVAEYLHQSGGKLTTQAGFQSLLESTRPDSSTTGQLTKPPSIDRRQF